MKISKSLKIGGTTYCYYENYGTFSFMKFGDGFIIYKDYKTLGSAKRRYEREIIK